MNKIGIFIPVYFREDQVKKSLLSLLKTNTHELNVTIHIGINGATKTTLDFLKEYKNTFFPTSTFNGLFFYNYNKNIGKAKIINSMVNKQNIDYVVSYDSDIEVVDINWLHKFLYILKEYNTNNNGELAALCGNFIGNNVHIADIVGRKSRKINKKYTIVTTNNNKGVAGGVLITYKKIWDYIGGYKADKIFGSDDGDFMISCNKIGKIVAYVEEIKFYHPNDDEEYHVWKVKACENKLSDDELNGFYEKYRKYENI